MWDTEFREKRKIEEPEESKDILLKDLEIAHKRELEFGKYIMLIKGWAVTLFSALLYIYFSHRNSVDRNIIILIAFILPFFLFWVLDALMGAYQRPYYKAIIETEDELAKEKKERSLIPLTYENEEKAYRIVKKNLLKCAFHLSVVIFYLPPIILLILLWYFSTNAKTSTNIGDSQVLILAGVMVNIALFIVNIIVAFFIRRQVKAAELENKKSVVPVMGITLGREKINGKEKLTEEIDVYVKNNIALNVTCEILCGKEIIFPEKKRLAAIPPLRTDERLPIWTIGNIKKYIINSTEEKKVEFRAKFTYESILKDKYESEYSLKVWYDKKKLCKEENLEIWLLPWNR